MTLPHNILCSMHFVTHAHIAGSLRQEVLQLQLSAKVSLGNSSFDHFPSLVPLQADPEALHLYNSACCSESSLHHS